MTLNFPDSPSTGDIYTDSTSGFQYEWNGTVWISTDPQRAANIKELDDISGSFNGSTTQFNLRVSSSAVEPVSDAQVLISVGGVMQNPTNDYTVSGSTITFTTAPSAGLTFFGTFLGQALSLNTVQDGTVEFASFKTGTAGVGIKQRGSQIGVGITQIDFVGTANTVVAVGNTVSVDVTGGIHTTGLSRFSEITASGLNVLGISSVKDLRSVGVATLTTGSATNFTVTNLVGTSATATTLTASNLTSTNVNTTNTTVSGIATVTGIIDGNGGANISGGAGLVASSAKISDLTSGRVTYAGGSGELQDSGNLTFSGSELTASSATVSDLTDNRVVIAGSSGALEDSSNLTFDGSTLTVNGDVSVAGTITYQEVSEIDAVGFVTARKGVRVTNGGIIVTAGLSTFSDDVKLAGANYNITFDRSADDLIFDDNAKLAVGSGSDYQLYHDGTYTWALDSSSGGLHQQSTKFVWQSRDDSENMAIFHEDGACRFYYNGTERVSTTSVGVNVVGNVDCDSLNNAGISTFANDVEFSGASANITFDKSADSLLFQDDAYVKFGASNDLQIHHSGSHSFIQDAGTGSLYLDSSALRVRNYANSNTMAQFIGDGAVELYYNAVKTFETVSDGIKVLGPEGSAAYYYLFADEGDDNADRWRLQADTSGNLNIANYSTGSWVDALSIDGSGKVLLGTTTEGHADSDNLTIAGSGNEGITIRSGANSYGNIFFSDATSGAGEYAGYIQYNQNANAMYIGSDGGLTLTLDSSHNITAAGTISDDKGNVRRIPQNYQTSAYTLVAADAGKHIYYSGSAAAITVPPSVFSVGDAITIISANSSTDITIVQGTGVTVFNSADASSGTRTLASKGMATLICVASNVFAISGSGLS